MAQGKKKKSVKSKSVSTGSSKIDGLGFHELKTSPSRSSGKLERNNEGHRKRGWRDIEAISERVRLKKMLTDIWHEDIELDEDIFGDFDHLAGYYSDIQEEVEIELDEELLDEEDEIEENEEK